VIRVGGTDYAKDMMLLSLSLSLSLSHVLLSHYLYGILTTS
jgi:hypothetical protein